MPSSALANYNGGKTRQIACKNRIFMRRASFLLLLYAFLSRPCRADSLIDMNLGRSVSGSFQGSSLQQQTYGLNLDYMGTMRQGIFGFGAENYGLGLGIYTAQLSYQSNAVKYTGGNFFVTFRLGWLSLLARRSWLISFTPEIILLSRLAVASYSEAILDGESFQSASLSDYSGHGAIRLPFYIGKRLGLKFGSYDLYVGASISSMIQNFSSKNDNVVATSPSSGQVSSLDKSSQGNYPLQLVSLQLNLSFLH